MVFKVLKKSSPVPKLIFAPASMEVYKDKDVLVSVVAQFSLCPVPAAKMIFSWSQVSGPEISEEHFTTGSQFYIPGGSLTSGQTYTVAARVEMEGNPAIAAESMYTIHILQRALISSVRGGNMIVSSALSDLKLDASSSSDPDASIGAMFEKETTIQVLALAIALSLCDALLPSS